MNNNSQTDNPFFATLTPESSSTQEGNHPLSSETQQSEHIPPSSALQTSQPDIGHSSMPTPLSQPPVPPTQQYIPTTTQPTQQYAQNTQTNTAPPPSSDQVSQQHNPSFVDYAHLDTPQSPPVMTEPHTQTQYYEVTPQYSQDHNTYILNTNTDFPQQKSAVNWLRTGIIVALLVISVSGAGGAFYMIKTTTDSASKAVEMQNNLINEIIKETDISLPLTKKAEAGYKNPLKSSINELNPFAEVINPFDEIGF